MTSNRPLATCSCRAETVFRLLPLKLADIDGDGAVQPAIPNATESKPARIVYFRARRIGIRSSLKKIVLTSRPCGSPRLPPPSFHFQHSHHPVVFVIEDVTVEHPLPRIIVVTDDDARRRVLRDVEHVLPGEVRL